MITWFDANNPGSSNICQTVVDFSLKLVFFFLVTFKALVAFAYFQKSDFLLFFSYYSETKSCTGIAIFFVIINWVAKVLAKIRENIKHIIYEQDPEYGYEHIKPALRLLDLRKS